MTGGTLEFGLEPDRSDRGTGDYVNLFTECLFIDSLHSIVNKSEPTNVTMNRWRLAGKGCSARGCDSLIATPDMTPAQVASAFYLHNAYCHNEKHFNHVVYLWLSIDPVE